MNQAQTEERYYMLAEAQWYDGTDRYEKGVVTVGRNRQTGMIFHYTFSLKAPTTLQKEYSQDGFKPCMQEDPLDMPLQGRILPYKTIPDDGSVISDIEDRHIGFVGVTVDDRKSQLCIKVYIDTD